jgi:hypothetical protein
MKKKRVPKEVSAYFSKIGKNGYKAKVKKLLSGKKVGSKKNGP